MHHHTFLTHSGFQEMLGEWWPSAPGAFTEQELFMATAKHINSTGYRDT